MNKLLLTGALALIAATAQADLIPITPEQFFADQRSFIFFDEARVVPYRDENGKVQQIHGWVSRFGSLNGGVYFNTDLFASDRTDTALIWWDFSGLPGYRLTHLLDYSNGQEFYYEIPPKERVRGSETLTAIGNIDLIGFYGRTSVPESGSTLLLFASSAGILLTLYRRYSY